MTQNKKEECKHDSQFQCGVNCFYNSTQLNDWNGITCFKHDLHLAACPECLKEICLAERKKIIEEIREWVKKYNTQESFAEQYEKDLNDFLSSLLK